jgi:hypothetical protein
MFNLSNVMYAKKKEKIQIKPTLLSILIVQKINSINRASGSRHFFFCTSKNATRHHRCGNETKSVGLVLRKSASIRLQVFQNQ